MTTETPLQVRLLEQMRAHLLDRLQPGDRINEAKVADQLGVSRTPIRRVLARLESNGVIDYAPRRGFFLRDAAAMADTSMSGDEDLLDDRVMRDMAVGELTGVLSERALMQRYSVSSGVLKSTLRRLTRDHLVEPSPGRGWIFADVSAEALADSYRFRQIIEPAGILADNYDVDVEALLALRDDHAHAIKHAEGMSSRRLFDLDARFHLVVAQGTGTRQFINIIKRQNNIRRVAEYIGYGRLKRIRQSMSEHEGIISALLERRFSLAASLMLIHLQISMQETFEYMDGDLQRLRADKLDLRPPAEKATSKNSGGRLNRTQ